MTYRELGGLISAHCNDLEAMKAMQWVGFWMGVMGDFAKINGLMEQEVDSESYVTQIEFERKLYGLSSVEELQARVEEIGKRNRSGVRFSGKRGIISLPSKLGATG